MPTPALPTWPQAILSSLLLLALSLSLLPLTLLASITAYARARFLLSGERWVHYARKDRPRHKAPVALVNGGRMQKALTVARVLAQQGYVVIAVEEQGWGALCPLRFSSAVSKFITVPRADTSSEGGTKAYVDALVRLAKEEKVNLFVPCSGAGTTIEDAIAAQRMRKQLGVDTVIQDPDLATHLHEKDKFIDLVQHFGLDVPQSHLVSSVEELVGLLGTPGRPRMIIKCSNVLDDVARSDMTTYPLLNTKTGQPDWTATEKRLRALKIPITPQTPYLVQEFIGGRGVTEWCTHATVLDGKIRSFVCCPSNDMLMTYHNASYSEIGARALRWTEEFLQALRGSDRWKDTRLDGEFSMDFMHQPPQEELNDAESPVDGLSNQQGRLVVIECNPRVHTAIVLLAARHNLGATFVRSRAQNASLAAKAAIDGGGGEQAHRTIHGVAGQGGRPSDEAALQPNTNQLAVGWVGHDLPARILPQLLPAAMCRFIHPFMARSEPALDAPPAGTRKASDLKLYDLSSSTTHLLNDPVWHTLDPWPFFAMYHLHWPFLLLHQLIVRRKKWSRINVSTSRIFEC